MSSKKETAIIRERERRCVRPELFGGWSSEQAYTLVENVFLEDAEWMAQHVLNFRFRSFLERSRRQRHWSFGYCFDIVEVTKIVFDSASQAYEPFFKKTKKTGNDRLDKHHVLKVDDRTFDPAVGGEVAWARYRGYRKCRKLPQSPGDRVIRLYIRMLDFCCSTGQFTHRQQEVVQKLKAELLVFERRLVRVRRKKASACIVYRGKRSKTSSQ